MSDNSNPGKIRIISLFISFLILFVVLFSLGVIVGKGLSERDTFITEKIETVSPPIEYPEITIKTEHEELVVIEERSTTPDAGLEESPRVIRGEGPMEAAGDELIKEQSGDGISKPVDQTARNEYDEVQKLGNNEAPVTSDPNKGNEINTKTQDIAAERASIEERITTGQNKRPKKVKLPPIDPQGDYTVQIGSFLDRETAESALRSMKNKGYPVFVNTMTSSDKRTWYRVRVGTFDSVEIAEDYGENLKILEPEVKIVFITPNN